MNFVPTSQQRAAIESSSARILVSAGAGTGKTAVLVARYLWALEAGLRVRQIVAITFTRKAASEMTERIREAVRERQRTRPAQRRLWRSHEEDLEGAHISTIHSFFAAILHDYAVEAGVDPHFRELDELQAMVRRAEVCEVTLAWLLGRDDAAFRQLVEGLGLRAVEELLLECLDQRHLVEWLGAWLGQRLGEEPRVPAGALLARWAEQLREYKASLLAEVVREPRWRAALATLRSVGGAPGDKAELARRKILDCAEEVERAADVEASAAALMTMFRGFRINSGKGQHWRDADLEAFRAAAVSLRELVQPLTKRSSARLDLHLGEVDEQAAELYGAFLEAFRQLQRRYAVEKGHRGELDFDDLLYRSRDLLRRHEGIRAALQRRFRYYLVDEFQDVDYVQDEVLSLLSRGPAPTDPFPMPAGTAAPTPTAAGEAGPTDGAATFYVGDAKQSIYRFRRAEVEIFNALQRQGPASGVAAHCLQENFRSLPGLLDFLNELFERLMPVGVLKPYEVGHEQLLPKRPGISAEPCVEVLLLDRAGTEGRRSLDDLRVEEADSIACRIKALVEDEGVAYREVALLFQAMTSAPIYEQALQRQGIPYRVLVRADFFKRQEYFDLVSLLRCVAFEEDDLALAGLLRSPLVAASDEGLFWLTQRATLHEGLAAAGGIAEIDAPDRRALDFAADLLRRLRARRDRATVPELLAEALEASGLEAVLGALPGGEERVVVVRKVLELAEAFEASQQGSLCDFLLYLEHIEKSRIEVPEPEASRAGGGVQLLSVHAAKGLEFPVVILPDLSRRPPARKSRLIVDYEPRTGAGCGLGLRAGVESEAEPVAYQVALAREARKEEAERRRLFYVACTRARDRLIFVGAAEGAGGNARGAASWMSWLTALLDLPDTAAGAAEVRALGRASYVVRAARAGSAEAAALPLREAVALAAPPLPAEELRSRVAPVEAAGAAPCFSVTQLHTYRQCPKRYFYRYVEEAPEAWGKQQPGAAFDLDKEVELPGREVGQLAHHVLEHWRGDLSETALSHLLDQALDGTPLLGSRRAALRQEIEALARRFAGSELAQRLRAPYHVRSEVPFLLNLGGAWLQGKIDKLFWQDGQAGTIIDFKTDHVDQQTLPLRVAHHTLQVRLYALALRRLVGRVASPALLHFLRTSHTVAVSVEEKELEAVEAETKELLQRLQAADFSPHPEHCPSCPYQLICSTGRERIGRPSEEVRGSQ
ncbi:MAG: UvrD-helicase domain-containing protein [Candidatus Tectomicrobia bacterium]|nr:UvrD-helicase domain-containing protein [Candidatus Tectomicrobia bacterium]